MRTFRNLAPSVSEQLRILWTSEGYTPHAIAAHPSVPYDVVDRLQGAMLAMHADSTGEALLKSIEIKNFVAAQDHEWDDVRDLNIQLLNDLITQ